MANNSGFREHAKTSKELCSKLTGETLRRQSIKREKRIQNGLRFRDPKQS